MLPRGRALILSWTLATFGLAASPWGFPADRSQLGSSPGTSFEKVAIFGVDAGDWAVVDRLVASGHLPTFARLKRVAALGILQADPPLLSPIIWTTIATGRPPEEHGVLDFMVDRPGGRQVPVTGGARRVKALWEIWSGAGRRVLVVGWWATWPADRVRGLVVSDRVAAPHLKAARPDSGLVHPPASLGDVTRMIVPPESLDRGALARLIPVTPSEFDAAQGALRASSEGLYRDRIAHFLAAVAAARTYRRISTEYARKVDPDFFAVYYEVVDTASHLFVADRDRGDRAVAAAYREVDDALADTARALDPNTLVLVVSDHGFHPADAGIREDPSDLTAGATAWHRPYGIIAAVKAGLLAGTMPAGSLPPLEAVSALDIAPTLLARAGLPVAADMPGRMIPALAPRTAPSRVASYGAHDLPDTPASGRMAAPAELARLRALGYVSGTAATSSLARVNLGEILYRKGDLKGAARELEAVLRGEPLNLQASLWLARSYVGLNRSPDALAVYDRLVQAAVTTALPLDPIVVLAATDIDLAAGRVHAARARFRRLPARALESAEGRVAQAAVAEAERRPAIAERGYRETLARWPADVESLQRLVDLLVRQKRADEAVGVTAAAARAFPASAPHRSLAGTALLSARRYADAERAFAEALHLAPDAQSVLGELARAQLLGGRPDAALATIRRARPSREVEMLRGAALAAKRDWLAAIPALRRALEAGPPAPDVLNALAAAQLEAGQTAEAIRSLEQSLSLQPDQPAARALLQRARTR